MWSYSQSTGELTDPEGDVLSAGYSGAGAGKNNPSMQTMHNIGPIPRGSYRIGSFFDDPGGKGPVVAHLFPDEGTETFDRTGFMIHGDNATHTASEGCVILPRNARELIAAGEDRGFVVTS